MNRFLWMALLSASALASCHKHNTPANSLSLIGKWRTTVIYDGGFAGTTHNVYPDSLYILTLNKDSTYEYNKNGRVAEKGFFVVSPYKTPNSATDTLGLIFSRHAYMKLSIHLEKDKLRLTAYDIEAAPSSSFIKAD
ncbi:MAG TPA: hypothetical protein VI233_16640 [Puia sp.]